MPDPYAPDEDAKTIFLERTFIAGDFITGVGYGVQLVLYTSCTIYLWNIRKTRTKSKFLLAYITLLLCVQTINEIVQARTVQMVYIDNRNFPGGPWAYFMATQNLPINVVYLASYFAVTWLSDLLVFWRCWVIWSAFGKRSAFFTMLFPGLLLMASLAMGVLWTLQSSQPGLSMYSALPLAYGTSYYAISLSTNIILTFLIILRLFIYRRTMHRTMSKDHATQYLSLSTIIIESASLYSVFAIGFLITYAVNNPMNQIFLSLANSAQQIANYLIIYRVARGRGWGGDTTTIITGINFAGSNSAQSAVVSLDREARPSQGSPVSAFNKFHRPPPLSYPLPSVITMQEPHSFQQSTRIPLTFYDPYDECY